jgi:hypothetical protein
VSQAVLRTCLIKTKLQKLSPEVDLVRLWQVLESHEFGNKFKQRFSTSYFDSDTRQHIGGMVA